MSHNPPTSSAPQLPSLTGADPALVRACLLNVVEALNRTVLPELSGGARARAGECATILQRAAQSLGPADAAVGAGLPPRRTGGPRLGPLGGAHRAPRAGRRGGRGPQPHLCPRAPGALPA